MMNPSGWKRYLTVISIGWMAILSYQAVSAVPTAPPVERELPESMAGSFKRFTLQPGTTLHVMLQTPVHTAINQVEDPVEAQILQNVYLGRELILSRNTRFEGRMVRLEPPLQGRDAILQIRFEKILLEDGEALPIQAHIMTHRPDYLWGGGLTQGTKPRLVTHRVFGIGEYNQTVMTGPRAMGQHIEFAPGEHWVIVLEAPLTVIQADEP